MSVYSTAVLAERPVTNFLDCRFKCIFLASGRNPRILGLITAEKVPERLNSYICSSASQALMRIPDHQGILETYKFRLRRSEVGQRDSAFLTSCRWVMLLLLSVNHTWEYSSAKCVPPYLTSRTADQVLEYFCWKVPSNEWTEFRAFKNLDRKKMHFYFLHYLIEI